MLKIGENAPNFTATTPEGQPLLCRRYVVARFYCGSIPEQTQEAEPGKVAGFATNTLLSKAEG
jgi:hypothetical protein